MNTALKTIAFTAMVATACGGSSKSTKSATSAIGSTTGNSVETGGEGAQVVPPLDFSVAAIAIIENQLKPRALTRLEWPVEVPDRALTAQRRRVQRAKESSREREQLTLATILWAGDTATSETKTESRDLLRAITKEGGASESTLVMLSIAELSLGDASGASTALSDLILRFPKSNRHWGYRAARASIDLEAGNPKKAAEIIDGADLTSDDTPSEVYYVAGWIKYRSGDYPAAYALLANAAKNWADLDTWDYLRDELYRFAAMANVSDEESSALIAAVIKGAPKRRDGTKTNRTRTIVSGGKRITVVQQTETTYSMSWELVQLASAYLRAGRFEQSKALLPDTLAVSDFPGATAVGAAMLASTFDAAGTPEEASSKLVAAWKAFAIAEDQYEDAALASLGKLIVDEGARLAVDYEAIYEATGDVAYGRGAATLYSWLGGTSEYPNAAAAKTKSDALANVSGSTKDPLEWTAAFAEAVAHRTRLSLRPCYYNALQKEPSLTGTVRAEVRLEEGVPTVTLSPEPAESGLGAVSTCVLTSSKSWWLPKAPVGRPVTITVPINFSTIVK